MRASEPVRPTSPRPGVPPRCGTRTHWNSFRKDGTSSPSAALRGGEKAPSEGRPPRLPPRSLGNLPGGTRRPAPPQPPQGPSLRRDPAPWGCEKESLCSRLPLVAFWGLIPQKSQLRRTAAMGGAVGGRHGGGCQAAPVPAGSPGEGRADTPALCENLSSRVGDNDQL